jgi:hypothetical protein
MAVQSGLLATELSRFLVLQLLSSFRTTVEAHGNGSADPEVEEYCHGESSKNPAIEVHDLRRDRGRRGSQ